uniref:CSON013584 protein n=1 Tax=Culicoides sonorensis TaxID=179676 RepID=A0A336M8I2_CULSO
MKRILNQNHVNFLSIEILNIISVRIYSSYITMSLFQSLEGCFCFNSSYYIKEEDQADRLLKENLKIRVDELTEDESENNKNKLYHVLENLTEFQRFLLEIIGKSNNLSTDQVSFHPKIVNIIFLLAKIGLLEVRNSVFDENTISRNKNNSVKRDLELEVIKEIMDDDKSFDDVPVEMVIDDVQMSVETKNKMEMLANELRDLKNLREFKFADLKKATNFFNEERYEGINKPGRFIAPGRIGKVFAAVNLIENLQFVVVKQVRQVEKYADHFIRELKIVSQLNHPNIIKLYGYSIDELPCIVYEFTRTGSLKRLLENTEYIKKSYHTTDRINALLEISSALSYLHNEKNMYHGELKPENILLHNSIIRLSGFGLTPKEIVTQGVTNRMAGTNFYIAPELEDSEYSFASEVYSFGVIMMQVLTGLKVFDTERNENERYLPRHIEKLMQTENYQEMFKEVPRINNDVENPAYTDLIKLSQHCSSYAVDARPDIKSVHEKLQNAFNTLKNAQ